jgi:hypothetical protein
MQTTTSLQAAAGATSWCISFGTDFNGMDLTSCALDATLLGELLVIQVWASDIWAQAQDFCRRNHRFEQGYPWTSP